MGPGLGGGGGGGGRARRVEVHNHGDTMHLVSELDSRCESLVPRLPCIVQE